MRGRSSCAGVCVLLVGMLGLIGPGWAKDQETPGSGSSSSRPSAEQLVNSALESEYSPGRGDRNNLLQEALKQDPDYSPARWHAGQVRQGDEWLPVAEAEYRATADPRLAEYRQMREKQGGTPQGELSLARWCRNNGLEPEARLHWLNVLRAQPQHQEALKSLGLHWENGRLVGREQAKEAKAKLAEARSQTRKDWTRYWTPLVTRWHRSIDRREADYGPAMKEEIESLTKLKPQEAARAIGALGTIVLKNSRAKGDQKPYQVLSEKLVETLDATQAPWVSPFLAWYAADHPIEAVRTASADALGRRPMETYVPLLVARMRAPVEAEVQLIAYPDGGMAYQHSFYVDGPEAILSATRNEAFFNRPWSTVVPTDRQPPDPLGSAEQSLRTRQMIDAANARARAIKKAADTQHRVEQYNAAANAVNERMKVALSRATGMELAANPNAWYKWWRDQWYEQYELTKPPEEKPIYEVSTYQPTFTFTHSCFPRGVKVWTATGPMPIETIKIGDRVLSQNPHSGELAYKPVVQVSARAPTPLIKIGLGRESITSTRAHPFWVSGQGWKMAKDLKAGMPLHTVSGAVTIESVEELPAAKPWGDSPDTSSYNLIVDQFHTYFVGEQRLLVHDNQLYPFDGVLGPVPGLDVP